MKRALLFFFSLVVLTGNSSTKLTERIGAIAASIQGRVGVAVAVLEGGPLVELNAADRYPMQSVYKLPIAMHVLRLVDDGTLTLDQSVHVRPEELVPQKLHSPFRDAHPAGATVTLRELLRLNVAESDGTACDVLLQMSGGPEAVMRFLQSIDVDEVIVADTERELARVEEKQYRNSATPRGAMKLLRAVHESRGLSAESGALLRSFLIDTPTGPRRLKGALPPGTVVAHKTGTSRTNDGITAATNDIGIITLPDGRHLAIAVFVSDAKGDAALREGVIARIARAAYDASMTRATHAKN